MSLSAVPAGNSRQRCWTIVVPHVDEMWTLACCRASYRLASGINHRRNTKLVPIEHLRRRDARRKPIIQSLPEAVVSVRDKFAVAMEREGGRQNNRR